MNNLLGAHLDWYDPINAVSFFVMLIYNLTNLKIKKEQLSLVALRIIERLSNKKVKRIFLSKTFWAVIEIIVITCVQCIPIAVLNKTFGNILKTGANYFGTLLFIPYILILFCWILGLDPIKQIDLITPAFPIALVPVKIACLFAGCCNGIVTKYGLYNAYTGLVEFPSQILECVVALGIFVFLITWKKKITPGTRLPIYIIIYSALRYVTETTRGQEIVFNGLKKYQILCVIAIVISFIQIVLVEKYGEKLTKICTCKKDKKVKKD